MTSDINLVLARKRFVNWLVSRLSLFRLDYYTVGAIAGIANFNAFIRCQRSLPAQAWNKLTGPRESGGCDCLQPDGPNAEIIAEGHVLWKDTQRRRGRRPGVPRKPRRDVAKLERQLLELVQSLEASDDAIARQWIAEEVCDAVQALCRKVPLR